MPRRREVPKREILPDPKRQEGCCRAHHLRCPRLHREEEPDKDPLEAFTIAINNVKPMVEVKSRRVGGANYQVPSKSEAARKRGEKSMAQRLANELLEASEGRGGAMKKRDEVHRMAEANRAFSHFRF
ncbi:ribosomal protein s7p/S5e domain-containing protein [Ditylenchus destructor]|uniref:Ribosomal protein s7p/S5e domain-containing protein n=1 Tax=Ditylenchus destructor TaxID=166010 RepID=A0AAD4QVB6_9BILA|nr:ribosomal protein s7p/S5e domain-containing protein [Ditylenchus destructor]